MTAATARAPWVPAQKDAGQACDDSVVAGLVACAQGGDQQAWDVLVERAMNLWVPIIRPCWSGSMPVFVEGCRPSVSSADIEVRDPLNGGSMV